MSEKYFLSITKAQYTPPTPTRRNCFVASRRRGRCVHEFATTADGFVDANAQRSRRPWPSSRLPTGVFSPTTRRNCRQLVANSCTHRRRDETRQFRLVGVGGVYWALVKIPPFSLLQETGISTVSWYSPHSQLVGDCVTAYLRKSQPSPTNISSTSTPCSICTRTMSKSK